LLRCHHDGIDNHHNHDRIDNTRWSNGIDTRWGNGIDNYDNDNDDDKHPVITSLRGGSSEVISSLR
jgi:hypothetical protein